MLNKAALNPETHPTLEHLLARKGKSGPFSDGRKIIMVLYGGIMRGVRSGGAVMALEELGLTDAFDEIYAVSSGFPTACYFLSKKTEVGMSLYLEELVDPQFLHLWRVWKGMDVGYLIRMMKEKKPLDLERIFSRHTKLYVRVVNLQNHAFEYLEVHSAGRKNFWPLVHAAVSVPILHRLPSKIGNYEYIDTNINGYLPEHTRYALSHDATDVLVIYNASIQRRVNLASDPRVFEIYPPSKSGLSRFERNPKVLRKAAAEMKQITKSRFGF